MTAFHRVVPFHNNYVAEDDDDCSHTRTPPAEAEPPSMQLADEAEQRCRSELDGWLQAKFRETQRSVIGHVEMLHKALLLEVLEQVNGSCGLKEEGSPLCPLPPRSQHESNVSSAKFPRSPQSQRIQRTQSPKSPKSIVSYAKFSEDAEETDVVDKKLKKTNLELRCSNTGQDLGQILGELSGEVKTDGSAQGSKTDIGAVFRSLSMQKLRATVRMGESIPQSMFASLEKFVNGVEFEFIFATAIMLNTLTMAMNFQYDGLQTGYELQYQAYEQSAEDAWPMVADVLKVFDRCFTILFTFELGARFLANRWRWFWSMWSYIDCTIVIVAWTSWIYGDLGINPTFVRLMRFGKLLRLVRVVRFNSFLDSLKIIVLSIKSSFNTLFWSLCILLLIQCVAGMFISNLVEGFIKDETKDVELRRQVFGYYGTFWRSIITMFEITFANWPTTCWLLVDHVNEALGVFFLVYRCAIGFAVLSVIQAVFIQQTMKTAQLDEEFSAEMKNRERTKFVERLMKVYERLDTNQDGVISWDEFMPILDDQSIKAALASVEIEPREVETLFRLLDDGDGQVSVDEFIEGMTRLKGQARAVDLMVVLNLTKRLAAKFDSNKGSIQEGHQPLLYQ